MGYDNVCVYGGLYDRVVDANTDYSNLDRLYSDGIIGPFQAAMVEKREDGKVKVLQTTSVNRREGAAVGGAIGALLGVIFPPAILVTAAAGAGIGAAAGDISKGWTRGDVKRLGEQLVPGQTAVIVVAEAGPALEAATVLATATAAEAELVAAEDRAVLLEMLAQESAPARD